MRGERTFTEKPLDVLTRERMHLAFLLGSSHDGFLIADREWRIVFLNESAPSQIGLSAKWLRGRVLWEVAGKRDAGNFRGAIEHAREIGEPVVLELHKGGRRLVVRAVPHGEDTLIHIRDATGSRRTEEQRSALLGAEREARSRAEEALRTKDDFLLTISHELRTPLTTILGWLEMVQNDSSGTMMVRAREAIERSARLQAKLVGQLLDLASLSGGRQSVPRDVFDLNEALASSLRNMRSNFEGRDEAVRVQSSVGELFVVGDQDLITKAIDALLENALVYTPAPGRIMVRTAAAGAWAELEIEDTGIGIEAEFMPFLFDRFRHREDGFRRRYNGLGLGLTIARAILDLHDGAVEAESGGPGSGSTFRIRLPLAVAASEAPAMSNGSEIRAFDALAGCTVLLVDDDSGAREILGALLESRGARVLVASSGETALRKLRQVAVDVVVCDIGMPGMSGLEVMERIRSDPRTASVKALALTAYSDSEVRRLCQAAGFNEFARKPIGRADLLAAVSDLAARNPDLVC